MPDNVIPTSRLEAFSDAVIAIVITIMVIEMKKPPGYDLSDLAPVIPIFLSYIMSFTYLGIFWSNHHHLMHVAKQANARTMWANLHWLFWMSLIPFTTSWLGHNHGRPWPTILYGCVLLMVGLGYMILREFVLRSLGDDSPLFEDIRKDLRVQITLFCYLSAIAIAFFQPLVSEAIFLAVALLWIVPERHIERAQNL